MSFLQIHHKVDARKLNLEVNKAWYLKLPHEFWYRSATHPSNRRTNEATRSRGSNQQENDNRHSEYSTRPPSLSTLKSSDQEPQITSIHGHIRVVCSKIETGSFSTIFWGSFALDFFNYTGSVQRPLIVGSAKLFCSSLTAAIAAPAAAWASADSLSKSSIISATSDLIFRSCFGIIWPWGSWAPETTSV